MLARVIPNWKPHYSGRRSVVINPLTIENPEPSDFRAFTPYFFIIDVARERMEHENIGIPTASLPPHMETARSQTADEVVRLMSRTPLFMTSLEDAVGDGTQNIII